MPSTATLDPRFRPYADFILQVAQQNNLRPQVTSTRRTRGQQETLYARYLACERGKQQAQPLRCLPAAPPGTSDHELGLAIDLVVGGDFRSAAQFALGRWWVSVGGLWSERDPVHFGVRHP